MEQPIFEIRNVSNGNTQRIWANGRTEGFDDGVIINRIPAALAPLEACGFGVFWKEGGQDCSVLKRVEADALEWAAKNAPAGASVEPIYRRVAQNRS